MDPVDLSRLSIADPSPSQSDQGNVGDAFPLSPKLRDKLNNLAKWRIDPSLIEFPVGASEFEGGHATVSRARFTPASAAGADFNNPKNVEGAPSPRDPPTKKKVVAVKKLKIGDGNSPEKILELALREAGFLVGLSSRYIIKLDGFVEDLPNNRIWLIFPWRKHGNLKEFVASQDWEIPERICLINDVARGVEYLHSRSPPIYHGDLKSINVLVTLKCRAVITDFGSARRLTKKDGDLQMKPTEMKPKPELEFQATFCATSNTMTFTGNEYTLRWAAPELLMDDEPSLSSDIWALGWIFYEVMTNSIPFENVQKDSMIIKHVVHGKLPCVTDHIRMSLILKLCSLMVECWNIDPTKRPTAERCRELLDWMPMVVPVPQRSSDQASSRTRSPELLMQLADMYLDQNDCINAAKLYTEALNIYTETSNNEGMADALFGLGQVQSTQSEYSKAATSYSKTLEISTDIGDRKRRSAALLGLAKVHCDQKEYSKAIGLYSDVIQISIDLDDQAQKATALKGLAEVYKFQGDYDQAVTFYSEALEIYSNIGSMFGRTTALAGLATVLRLQSKYSEAFALFSESLQISIGIGDKFGRAYALEGLARIHLDQDRYRDALCLYEEAAEIYEQIGNTRNAIVASRNAAHARSKLEVEPVKTPSRARALYSYTASPDDPNEISFSKGETLEIVDNSAKWWQARKQDGTTGTYVRLGDGLICFCSSRSVGSSSTPDALSPFARFLAPLFLFLLDHFTHVSFLLFDFRLLLCSAQ